MNARAALTAFPHTPPGVIGDALEEGVSYVGQTVLPKGGWTAVMYAARQGAGEAVAALADAGADLNATDPDGATPLALAVINGHARVAALLLARGADPNIADRTGMTPLYAAVDLHTMQLGFGRPDPPPATIAGSVEMVKALLAHGAESQRPAHRPCAEAGVYGWRRQARQGRHAVHARGAGRATCR